MDEDLLFELCLPKEHPLPPSGATLDPDSKHITISSLNPNLRFIGNRVSEEQISIVPSAPTMKVQMVSFIVNMETAYLQVALYRERYFIRDGYHRAVGLLREGIDVVPCIVIDAQSFDQVGSQPQVHLPFELLYSQQPPRLTDFWDEDVSRTVMLPAMRKVIRLSGDEFVVQG